MCQKMEPLFLMPHWTPLSVLHPPKKWYHHIAKGPAHLKSPSLIEAFLHQEKIDFLKTPDFGENNQTALE